MNLYVTRLQTNIPSGLPISQELIPALQISGEGYVSLTDESLYISVGSESASFDLYDLTIQQLVTDINSIASANLLQNGIAELLQLPDGQSFAVLPVTLYIPSDPAFFVLGMMARMIETRRRQRINQVSQINLQSSVTQLLDWWGASTGIPRYQSEPDVLYAQRIVSMRFRPTQNNYSIQRLLKTLGYTSTVSDDTTPGKFTVQIKLPSTPPSGFFYTTSQLGDIVNQVKSATYQATISLEGKLTDSVTVSDSISASVNPSAWTWGSFTWGQFNW